MSSVVNTNVNWHEQLLRYCTADNSVSLPREENNEAGGRFVIFPSQYRTRQTVTHTILLVDDKILFEERLPNIADDDNNNNNNRTISLSLSLYTFSPQQWYPHVARMFCLNRIATFGIKDLDRSSLTSDIVSNYFLVKNNRQLHRYAISDIIKMRRI